jgi:N-methylhydantoinase B
MDTSGLHVPRGTRILYCSNGGGGFGPPHEREVAMVLGDLRSAFIDRATAASVYGVVLDEAGDVDDARTRTARERLARERPEMGLGPDEVHPVGASVRLVPGA